MQEQFQMGTSQQFYWVKVIITLHHLLLYQINANKPPISFNDEVEVDLCTPKFYEDRELRLHIFVANGYVNAALPVLCYCCSEHILTNNIVYSVFNRLETFWCER